MATSTIDTYAMQAMINGIYAAQYRIGDLRTKLRNLLDEAENVSARSSVAAVSYQALDEAIDYLDRERPRLQTRLDLAQALCAEIPGMHSILFSESFVTNLDDLIVAANDGTLTAEQWQTLFEAADDEQVEGYQKWLGATFYNSFPPDKLASLVAALSADLHDHENYASFGDWAKSHPGVSYDEWVALRQAEYGDRLETLGTLLGAASRSDYPPLREGYASDMADVMKHPGASPFPVALSAVLSTGIYQHTFAETIADAVYDLERSQQYVTWRDAGHDLRAGYVVMPDGSLRTDVMSGVLAMLGHSPEAAQHFFSTGKSTEVTVEGQTVSIKERLAYLTTQRNWSSPYSDDGDGLGKALEAATTTYREADGDGSVSAKIATELFTALGQSEKVANGMPEGLKASVSNILAGYMSDVIRVAKEGGESDDLSDGFMDGDEAKVEGFPAGLMPNSALLTQAGLENLFYGLGRGENWETNLQTVLKGWAAADVLIANTQIQLDSEDRDAWRNRVKQDVSVLDFITDKVLDGAGAGDEAKKQATKLIGIVLDMAAAIPPLKAAESLGDWNKWVWDQAKDTLTDAVKDEIEAKYDADPKATAQDIQDIVKKGAAVSWLDALLNNGAISPEAIEAGLSDKNDKGAPITPALTRDAAGNLHANPNTRYFLDWASTNKGIPWAEIQETIENGLGW